MIRRFTALLLAFAMLHLGVARVDAACAMHDGDADHGMQHHGDASTHRMPCETPVSSDCCRALTSCAPILSEGEGSEITSIAPIAHLTVAAAVAERPLSRSTAPEPPPPKA